MTEQKTYGEMVNQNLVTFPATVDEPLKQTILDWFQYRYVCDNERFNTYFNRTLNRDMRQYNELLRVEPGISNYDWLVQQYRERERTYTGNGTQSDVRTQSATHKGDMTTKLNSNVITNGTLDRNTAESEAGNRNLSANGASTSAETLAGKDKTDYNETNSNEHTESGARGLDINGDSKLVKSGSEIDATKSGNNDGEITERTLSNSQAMTNGKREHVDSPHVKRKEVHSGDVSEWSGNSEISKTLPMSESYDSKDMIEPDKASASAKADNQYYEHAYQHMPALDWSTASAQAQNGHRGYTKDATTVTQEYEYGENVKGDVTTDNESHDSKTLSEGESVAKKYKKDVSTTKSFNARTDETKEQRAENENTSKAGNDAGTKKYTNDLAKSQETTGSKAEASSEDESDSRSKAGSQADISYQKVQNGGENTTSRDLIDSGDSSLARTTADSHTDRDRFTGRYDTPARILAEASAYIKGSSAWIWLQSRLEPCFLGIYEV